MTWTEALVPLRNASFRNVVVGRTVSMLGNGIAPIALAFAVLDLTGSAGDLGIVVAARSITNVLFVLVGGVIADRLPRQLVMVASALLSALFQGIAAFLMLTGTASMPLLAGCAALGGIASAFMFPATSALIGQLTDPETRKAANALNRMGANASMILGASLGGILVAAFNPGVGLAIDAGTFIIAACFYLRVRVPPLDRTPADATTPASTFHELRIGWREFIGRTWLWVVVLGFLFSNAAMAGAFGVLGPVIADDTLGRPAYGLAIGAETVGMVVGALVVIRFRVDRLLLAGVLGIGLVTLPLLALAFAPTAAIFIAACFIAGLGIETFGIAWETSMQEHVPADLLARLYSYDMLGSIIAIPLGQLAAGPAAIAFGPAVAITGAAVIVVLAVAGMVSSRSVRALRHNPVTLPEPVPV